MAVIDFHSHILPGMDDGSKDVDMSLKMLQKAASQGVDIMVATPHFYASQNTPAQFLKRRKIAWQQLMKQELTGLPRIMLGAEVLFYNGIGYTEDIESLCIEGTNLMLLEMPFAPWSGAELHEVECLLNRGILLLIAHLERYYPFQKEKKMISALLELPVCVQLNTECLLNWRQKHRALKMFRNGEAQILGSDCHNITNRVPNLGEGRNVLAKKLGNDILYEIDDLGTRMLRLQNSECF